MADQVCSPPDARVVIKALGKLTIGQTKDLAFRLGVELTDLDNIDSQFNGTDRNTHYIKAWLTTDSEASWGKIVDTLKEMNQNVLAANIASQHCCTSAEAQKRAGTIDCTL